MLFRDVITDVSLGRQKRSVLAFYSKRQGQEVRRRGCMMVLAIGLCIVQGFGAWLMHRPLRGQVYASDNNSDQRLTHIQTVENLSVLDAQGKPSNAAGQMVRPGQRLRYTLATRNPGTREYSEYSFQNDISDVLQYATVVDPGGARLEVTSASSQLVWPSVTVAAGETAVRSFTVEVSVPVTSHAQGQGDPVSYDLRMTNRFYGSQAIVSVAPPPTKWFEIASQALPHWSPLTVAAIGVVVLAGALWLWLRSRLIQRELQIFEQNGGHPR